MLIMKRSSARYLWIIAGIFLCISCTEDLPEAGFYDSDVYSIASFLEDNQEIYSTFWKLIEEAGLYHALNAFNPKGDGYTLFLPTDDAFDRYIEQTEDYTDIESLIKDESFMRLLIKYHLVTQTFMTSDFPYGALPDSTATGDYLTIGIEVEDDSSSYSINNAAPIVIRDIPTINGYIHVIDEVLDPISYNSYEWLRNNEGFSLITKALEITGLKDTMDVYRYSSSGKLINNRYTVFAEHDSIFERNDLYSIEDLIEQYHSPGYELDDPDGGLYQFAAYHLIEGMHYLNDFDGTSNLNTYALFPVKVSAGADIRINIGVDSFKLEITETDTILIDYIEFFYQESNVNTKNGPIHIINEIMELYQPSRSRSYFSCREEPVIIEVSQNPGSYYYTDPDEFELIGWSGTQTLLYYMGSGANEWRNEDYIELNGKFYFHYIMPKILPGKYELVLKADASGEDNATIQVYIDGKRLGGNINLARGKDSSSPTYNFKIGTLDFIRYEEHVIEIKAFIAGSMKFDWVSFKPI